jgi:signal transduction histidine kinase
VQRSPTYEELAQRVSELEKERQWREKSEAILSESEQKWRSLVEEQTAELKKEILERKRAEDQIKKLSKELEQGVKNRTSDLENSLEEFKKLDKMKDSFLSSVSHEFRAPLTSIRSFSEILLEYENEDPKTRKEFLHIINSESERLSRLVDDLLDLSQIESGRMVYNDDVMSLEEVIREAARTQFPSITQKSLRLILDLPQDLPSVLADRDRTRQVIANLLHNAIAFSANGGEIRISAEATMDTQSAKPAGWILVSVSDQGVGIEEKDLALIFDKYKQGPTDTLRDKPKGAGLGLPICKEIVTHYGGDIWVESKKNEGSTFFFTLPAAPPSNSTL